MTTDQWERRFACALGIAIWVHLTHSIAYGLWALGGVILCIIYAWMPDIFRWLDANFGPRS